MQSIKELIKNKDFKQLKAISEEKLIKDGFIKTEHFGWVLQKDVEQFDFLARDKGVPVIKDENGRFNIVSLIYREWKKLVENRAKARFANNQAVESIVP